MFGNIHSEYGQIMQLIFGADWDAPLKENTKTFEMLRIMLEIASVSNQMCERPSISKLWVGNTWYFDRSSRSWIEKLEFFIWNDTAALPKQQTRVCQCIYTHVMWLPTTLYVAVFMLDDITLSACVHTSWIPSSYEK